MKTIAKYVGILLVGAGGYYAVHLVASGYVIYQQHTAMWQWVQETDRLVHPDKYVAQRPQPPAAAPSAPTPLATVKPK